VANQCKRPGSTERGKNTLCLWPSGVNETDNNQRGSVFNVNRVHAAYLKGMDALFLAIASGSGVPVENRRNQNCAFAQRKDQILHFSQWLPGADGKILQLESNLKAETPILKAGFLHRW
jgi:hypothetical protein